MGNYTPAAHKAAMVADQQADQLPCACPANNLLYCFLEEVRRMRIALAIDNGSDYHSDNLTRNLKIALDNLRDYPFRVYDAKSAQEVKGIGASMANIIRDELFTSYPQEKPDEQELQQLQTARATLRVAEAAKRRRNVIANAAPDLPAPQIRRTSFGQESPNGIDVPGRRAAAAATASAATTAARSGRGSGRGGKVDTTTTSGAPGAAPAATSAHRDPPLPKPKKPYTPNIGTANYAFLICLLQAQRGPEKLEFLTKHELMSRAEASGLSNKPILTEAAPQGGFRRENVQQFYSGWSSWKTVVNNGLAAEYSNPKKIKLTFEGLALAEKLYRDAVTRGKVSPVVGLPATGPLLFQIEERPASGGAAAAAAARQAQEAAGLGPGALPSAALRRPSSAAARAGSGSLDVGAAPSTAAMRSAAAVAALGRASGGGSSVWPPAEEDYDVDDAADPLEMSLAQRLTGRGRGRGCRGERPPKHPATTSRHAPPVRNAGVSRGSYLVNSKRNDIFLDLAGGSSDEDDDYNRIPTAAQCRGERPPPQQQQQDEDRHPRPHGGPRPRKHRVSDEHVALMMEMGFSDKKARKALRKSLGSIENAVEIVTLMSSAGEEESSSDEEKEIEKVQNEQQRKVQEARATIYREDIRANVAAATAAAVAAGVPITRQPSGGNINGTNGGIANDNNGRGHIRTGSQPVNRPRLDPNSQPSQPDYINNSQPPNQQQQQQQRQNQGWWVQEADVRLPPLPPNRRFSEEYEVVLLVDGREQYSRSGTANRNEALQVHLSRMRGAGLAVEHRTLPIGDALWVARSRRNPSTEYVLDYILERKSLTDLLSSIKDSNRYTSQKYFLNRCGLRNRYYLIEGDPEMLPNPRDVKTIKTAAGSTEVIDGFHILRTKGVQETFRLYQSMTGAVVHFYSDLGNSSAQNTTTPLSFDAFKDHMRQQNQGSTTVHDIWGRMLIEIPGLGPDAASVILHNYPVPKLLYNDYKRALREGIQSGRGGVAVAQGLLVGLKGEMGQGRAIGPDKANKVYQALFMNHWNLQSPGV